MLSPTSVLRAINPTLKGLGSRAGYGITAVFEIAQEWLRNLEINTQIPNFSFVQRNFRVAYIYQMHRRCILGLLIHVCTCTFILHVISLGAFMKNACFLGLVCI